MQPSLFLDENTQSAEIIRLPDAELHYYPAFLAELAGHRVLESLLKETPWQQDHLVFGGRRVPVPRLQAWYGNRECRYGYSGLMLAPLPWTPTLHELRSMVEDVTGEPFNCVLLNHYRNGHDSVSWHSDDEPELGPDPVIASLSLGEARKFELKHRKTGLKSVCELGHGSLLVMGRGIQQNWQHQAPKQSGVTGSRLNLTFRNIVA